MEESPSAARMRDARIASKSRMETTMRSKALLGTTIVALTLALSACSPAAGPEAEEPMTAPSSSQSEMPEEMPEEMAEETAEVSPEMAVLEGEFMGLNDHEAAGTVMIEGDTVSLVGFSSSEGPDLHLYLADGTDSAAVDAGMLLGAVAWDEASQTFMLDGIDASEYTHVVVNCDMANAVFGAAEIA